MGHWRQTHGFFAALRHQNGLRPHAGERRLGAQAPQRGRAAHQKRTTGGALPRYRDRPAGQKERGHHPHLPASAAHRSRTGRGAGRLRGALRRKTAQAGQQRRHPERLYPDQRHRLDGAAVCALVRRVVHHAHQQHPAPGEGRPVRPGPHFPGGLPLQTRRRAAGRPATRRRRRANRPVQPHRPPETRPPDGDDGCPERPLRPQHPAQRRPDPRRQHPAHTAAPAVTGLYDEMGRGVGGGRMRDYVTTNRV